MSRANNGMKEGLPVGEKKSLARRGWSRKKFEPQLREGELKDL